MLAHTRILDTLANALVQSAAALAIAVISGCGKLSEPPEISRAPEESSTELDFWIARHEKREDGSQLLSAVGKLHGRPVGFDLELSAWRENPPGFVNMSTWDCKARLISQGPPSDELLRFMDSLYATGSSPACMVKSVEVQGFSPWKNPGSFEDGSSSFLLLFPGGFELDRPAEVWIEVDAGDRRITLREKEKSLRRVLIDALSASA
jgi:hypothetical protein